MNYILLSIALLFTGCTTKPVYQPADNQEYIEQLEAQTDQSIKADTMQVYTYAGIALFVAGVATASFTPRIRSGAFLILGGSLAMASPFILNSVWFGWVVGTAITLVLFDGLFLLYRFSIKYISNKTGSIEDKQEQ